MDDARRGARQPQRFDPQRADKLDDLERFTYLEPQALLALLDPPPRATLLDFGAGTGLYTFELARAKPDMRFLALEEQPEMLLRLRAGLGRSGLLNVEVLDPSGLAALRGRAERVLALNVLHELGDAALGELRASLAQGGQALFVDWNADVERPVGPPRDHVYRPDEAVYRLTQRGFAVQERSLLRYHYALVATASP
jgi:SAM-dependent methyltransferase